MKYKVHRIDVKRDNMQDKLEKFLNGISGEIISVNEVLDRKPTLINESPYESGWVIVIRPSKLEEELKTLMTHETGLADWLEGEIERVKAETEGV